MDLNYLIKKISEKENKTEEEVEKEFDELWGQSEVEKEQTIIDFINSIHSND